LIHRAYTLPYPYNNTGKTNISFITDAGASISTVEKEELIAGSKVEIIKEGANMSVVTTTAGGLSTALSGADASKKKIVIGGTINGADMSALSAFIKSNSITDVAILADGVTSIDNAFNGCTSLKSISLPNELTSIGKNAFNGCTSLTSISLPNELTSIGDGAFFRCTSLASISLSNELTSIEKEAFYNCNNLTSISLPDGVTSIGSAAFLYCSNLEEISLRGINDQFELALPTFGNEVFNGTKLTTLYLRDVPEATFKENLSTYSNWGIKWKAIQYNYNGTGDDLDGANYAGHWVAPAP